ncbi:D-rhamnosyltransferase WbpZ [Hyphomicrobium sp. 1Nfss2.1]|uniref:glycosyltransferase n=1 Tax=Hyphomicrobium sp. 1Nfss2.1 TaxID=3413936 RepID=UPI003C7BCFAF
MNILHFYKTAFPYSVGGVEKVIHELAKGSVARGHQVDVIALADVAEKRSLDGYTVHCCPTLFEAASTPVSFSAAIEFKKLARKADVINYHFPWPYMDVVHFATGVNKPSVATYHSDVVRQRRAARVYAPLRHAFLNSVDAIVATSPNYRATSVTLQRHLSKVEVIPLGITDTASTSIEPDNLRGWRDRFGEHFFLFVGALRYYKGLRTLIDAAQGTRVPVVIAGAGPTERELRAQAKRLNVDNVHLVGHVSDADKASLLTLCRAVVFPSDLRSEAFGVTLLEGAMFAKPLISSEIGTGTSYVNIDGETGIVVPPRNPAALRSAMERIWSDPSWAVEAGRRARLRYEALFTGERMCREYLRLYQDLLLRRKSVDLCSDAPTHGSPTG